MRDRDLFQDLPREIFEYILLFLSEVELVKFQRVCKRWRHVILTSSFLYFDHAIQELNLRSSLTFDQLVASRTFTEDALAHIFLECCEKNHILSFSKIVSALISYYTSPKRTICQNLNLHDLWTKGMIITAREGNCYLLRSLLNFGALWQPYQVAITTALKNKQYRVVEIFRQEFNLSDEAWNKILKQLKSEL